MREYSVGIDEYNRLLLHIQKVFKSDIEKMGIYKTLINGLKAYEDRILNKRIERPVQELLKNYDVDYYKRYGWYELNISAQNPYRRFEIMLAPREEKSKNTRFKISYLEDRLKGIQEKHKKDIINFNNISEIIGRYNIALEYFRAAERKLYDIPNWSTFSRF